MKIKIDDSYADKRTVTAHRDGELIGTMETYDAGGHWTWIFHQYGTGNDIRGEFYDVDARFAMHMFRAILESEEYFEA